MKKIKIVSIIMAVALAAALAAGCGSSKPDSSSKESSANTAAASASSAADASATSESESSTAAASDASSASEASSASAASSASEAASASSAASGELVPSITIEYGDVEAIQDLGSKAQNFEIEEGTVVAISGIYTKPISTMNINEPAEDGSLKGINMFVDGDWEAPAEKTDIDVIGTFVKGQYYMEFHVLPENITIK